jgi:predicted O-methyltransferase YrrM
MTATLDDLRQRLFETLAAHQEALRGYARAGGFPRRVLATKDAPRLRDDALSTTRLFPDREALLRAQATGATGGEVGVQRGNFARFMLDNLPVSTLHLFDLNTHMIRDDVARDPRVSIHTGASAARLRELPDATFDWLYIDGDHSYPGVRKDILQALDKVRPGGLIVFNDYVPWSMAEAIPYGVMAAVNETVNDGLDVVGLALTPTGHFDIALRR